MTLASRWDCPSSKNHLRRKPSAHAAFTGPKILPHASAFSVFHVEHLGLDATATLLRKESKAARKDKRAGQFAEMIAKDTWKRSTWNNGEKR